MISGVSGVGQVDFAGLGVQKVKLLIFLELDPCPRQRGLDTDRRLVVDQEAVDHRLPI